MKETQWKVVATSRDPNQAKRDLASLVDASSLQRVHFERIELEDESTIEKAAAMVKERHGKQVRLLLNMAGYLQPEKSLRQVTSDNIQKHLNVNTIGPLLVAKHFSPLLAGDVSQELSPIVANLSARTGSIGDNKLGGWHSYRLSKAALNMVTKTLSVELGHKGVICVSLHPGTVDTALSRPFVKNVPADKLFTPDQSASYLYKVIQSLKAQDNGRFIDWAGKDIEW